MIRLLDGTRACLHAVIDDFSGRILSWQLNDRFDTGTSAALLVQAGKSVELTDQPPTLMADGGVGNYNGSVDESIASGLLRRVLAMTEMRFSNSLIEACRRALEQQRLLLHQLDSVAKVRNLVDFYVEEHNARLPHSACCGQTPDEMYFGTGGDVPAKLADARQAARQARLQANRARQCVVCA